MMSVWDDDCVMALEWVGWMDYDTTHRYLIPTSEAMYGSIPFHSCLAILRAFASVLCREHLVLQTQRPRHTAPAHSSCDAWLV